MTTTTMHSLSPELLAANDGWLRALVRRLVDDGQTDDVLQEVWGHAMRTPPRDEQALPAWLATVARRIAGKKARSSQRRKKHEQLAAETRSANAVDPSHLVARVEERQRVAQTVLELDEPFRTVVLLRYFEELTPEQIAERLNIPGATVRSRLHRGHERLRAQFERERGKGWRGELALLCVPLGGGEVAAPAPAGKVMALLVAVPLVLAAIAWWFVGNGAVTPAPVSAPTKAEAATANVATATVEQPTSNTPVERIVVAADATPVGARSIRVRGQIVDPTGRGLSNLALTFVEGIFWGRNPQPTTEELGTSDLDGYFEVQVPRTRGTLLVAGTFATLRGWQVTGQEPATEDALLVATHVVQLSGHVVQPDGAAVPDIKVEVSIQDTFGLPVPVAGSKLVRRTIETKTDPSGHFALKNVPAFAFGDLRVGWNKAIKPIPTSDRHDLRIVMGTGRKAITRPKQTTKPQPRPQVFTIAGTVRSSNQELLAGACVRGREMRDAVTTKEDGAFQISYSVQPNTAAVIWVAAVGHQPQRLEVWPESGTEVATVHAQLTPTNDNGRALTGNVVTANGKGVRGMTVFLADPTPLELDGSISRFIEATEPHEFGAHTTTDGSGHFRIAGVLDRPYHVRVLDPTTGYAKTFGPLDPRRSCRLEVDSVRIRNSLTIRIVDHNNRPVPGAKVTLSVVKMHLESDSSFYRMTQTSFVGEHRTANAGRNGECQFANARGGELRINVEKPGWVKLETSLAASATAGNKVSLSMMRLMPIRVAAHGLDDHHLQLKLFDRAGNELDVKPAWRGGIYPNVHGFSCHRGHSIVGAVAENVVRAELRDLFSKEVLRTMSVVFAADGVTVLDFPQ